MTQSSVPGKVRSGYARDVAPELLTAEEKNGLAVPPADDHGGQLGKIPPALRKGPNYEAVDAAEAERRMIARRKGELPPIKGGLDDNTPTDAAGVKTACDPADQYADSRMEVHDSPSLEPQLDSDAAQAVAAVLKAFRIMPQARPQPHQRRPITSATLEAEPEGGQDYLSKRQRVTLEFKDGRYAIPVIDIKVTQSALLLVLPFDANGATFTPNSGADVGISLGNHGWNCYFPGTAFEVPELKVVLLAFLLKDGTAKSG